MGGSRDREPSELDGLEGSARPGRGPSYKLRANHHRRIANAESAESFLILSLARPTINYACIRAGAQRRHSPAWSALFYAIYLISVK